MPNYQNVQRSEKKQHKNLNENMGELLITLENLAAKQKSNPSAILNSLSKQTILTTHSPHNTADG